MVKKSNTITHLNSNAVDTQARTHGFCSIDGRGNSLVFFWVVGGETTAKWKKTASQRDRGKVEKRGREPRTIQFFQIRKQWKHYFFQVSSFCINFMKWIDAESAQRKEAEKQQQIVRKRFKLKRSTKQKISSYTYLEMAFEICSLDYIDWL